MPLAYATIFDMQNDATLRKQVTVACRIAARDILNEAPATPNHALRAQWARAIQGGTAPALLDRMLAAVCQNATLQAAAPAGPYQDSDVQSAVNGFIDAQS